MNQEFSNDKIVSAQVVYPAHCFHYRNKLAVALTHEAAQLVRKTLAMMREDACTAPVYLPLQGCRFTDGALVTLNARIDLDGNVEQA